jgi:hypothetical protein
MAQRARPLPAVRQYADFSQYRHLYRSLPFDSGGRLLPVAADLRNDYFGMLETNNNDDLDNDDQNQRAYAPRVDSATAANDAKTNYQNFVLKYMDDRFSNNTAYTYNTALATSTYEATYNLNNPVDNSGVQTAIPMKSSAEELEDDSKWSHTRGLYVDYVEPEALDVIKQAYTNCSNKTTQALRNACVLPYVPFTSVNLTELADWQSKLTATVAASLDKTVIQAANNAFYDDEDLDSNVPTRGNVFKGTVSSVNSTAFAMALITESNSGVALKLPIDTDESTLLFDTQQYVIDNSGGGGGNTGGAITFFINLLGSSTATVYPQVGDNQTSTSCTSGVLLSYIPYTCGFAPDSNGNMQIKVSGYTKQRDQSVPNGCRNNGTTTLPIIVDYNVTGGVNANSSAATLYSTSGDKTTAESAVLYFTPVAAADTLQVNFSGPTYWCPSNYNKQANGVSTGLGCTGNGSNAKPTWSSTLVTCPTGTPGI